MGPRALLMIFLWDSMYVDQSEQSAGRRSRIAGDGQIKASVAETIVRATAQGMLSPLEATKALRGSDGPIRIKDLPQSQGYLR